MKKLSGSIKKIVTFVSPVMLYSMLYGAAIAAEINTASDTPSCTMKGLVTLKSIIMDFVIGCVLVRTGYLIVAFAVIVFLWGIYKYMSAGESEQIKSEGKETMSWGIIGIFVMISLWGLVRILQSTFNMSV